MSSDRGIRWWLLLGAAALGLVGAIVAGVLIFASRGASRHDVAAATSSSSSTAATPGAGSAPGGSSTPARSRSRPTRPLPADPVTVAFGAAAGGVGAQGRTVPRGFLGFSFEFQAVRAYTGSDPAHINPVLVALMRGLSPGQSAVLRIGGDSTDVSYVPAAGVRPPRFVAYRLTPSWLATTAALQRATGARLIMGLNLAANQPALDAAEARAYQRAFAPGAISELEIGNEPNVYGKITVLHTLLGVPVTARPVSFGYPAYRRQFDAIVRRVNRARSGGTAALPLAGPALAVGPTPGPGSWIKTIPSFLSHESGLRVMTVHRYPLRNCNVPPRSPQYPSIPHLLSPYATRALAVSLARWLRIAHSHGRALRVDELNSVACRGKAGVSDTFASALWMTDALFSLVNAGVEGVNVHTLPDSAYELFEFSHTGGRWSALVRPVYYGLALFAAAAPPGSRLVPLTVHGRHPGLSMWATRALDGRVRVVLIDKSVRRPDVVHLTLPAGAGSLATVERMRAPSVAATGGVTLGGVGFGARTTTGALPAPHLTTLSARDGQVAVRVPAASAALVTLG